MARLRFNIFRKPKTARRCPQCKRYMEDAVEQQVGKGLSCEEEYLQQFRKEINCFFKDEIKEAILLSKTPELIQFSVNKIEIIDTETITISWELLNVKNPTLKGFGRISDKGTRQLVLKKSTDLILEFEAFNGDIYNSETLRVNVFPSPELSSFSISNTNLIKGDSTKISWKSKNIIKSTLLINGTETPIESNDDIEIIPEVDTKIELKLIGHLEAEIIHTENISVYKAAQIKSFTVDKPKILDKELITFNFIVENVTKVLLSGMSLSNNVDVTQTEEYQTTPYILNNHSTTLTFYLEVFDKTNNPIPKVPITVEVFPQPSILLFAATKEKILIGDEVELKWNVLNFSKLQLKFDNKLIDVRKQKSFIHKPKKSTEYKLIVESLENLKTIESSIQNIQVFNYVEVDFFSDKTHTVQTAPVTLEWSVRNATNIYMNEQSNVLDDKGKIVVHPNETTVYKIFASNDLDEVNSEIRLNVFSLPVIDKITFPKFPDLTLKLQETFTGSVRDDNNSLNATILPPSNLNKESTNKLFDYVNKKSTTSGNLLHRDIISKNISSEDILNLIKQRINYE